MHDAADRSLAAVVDVGHRTGDGTSGRDAAEDGRSDVCKTLSHQLRVRVVVCTYHTVSHRSREERLYGAEHGDGQRRSHKALDGVPCHGWHVSVGDGAAYREAVADGLNGGHAEIVLQDKGCDGHHDDGNERSRNLLAHLRSESDDDDAEDADNGAPEVGSREVRDIASPFLDEVRRHAFYGKSEEVLYLCGEDGHGNTARKSHHDGVGNILDDGAQLQQTEQQQEHASHDGGYHQSLYAILLYDAVDDDNEGAGWSAYLHLAAAEQRDDKSGDDGGDDAFLRGYAGGDAECDGKRQGDNTYDDASHDVGCQGLSVVRLEGRKKLWFQTECFHPLIYLIIYLV